MSKLADDQSRRSFLRSTGVTLAAAFGMAALPGIVQASAQSIVRGSSGASQPDAPLFPVTYHCYANSQTCGTGCPSGLVKYNCVASGCASHCTTCQSFSAKQEDYTYQVPACE